MIAVQEWFAKNGEMCKKNQAVCVICQANLFRLNKLEKNMIDLHTHTIFSDG